MTSCPRMRSAALRLPGLSLLVAVWAAGGTTAARADTLLETATLGPTGQLGGVVVASSQFIGARFSLAQSYDVSRLFIHVNSFPSVGNGQLFASIVPLANLAALPNAATFNTDVVFQTTFTPTSPSSEASINLAPGALTLGPGAYGLVFGSGRFGATGQGTAPSNNTDIGSPSYFFYNGTTFFNGGLDRVRMGVEGTVAVTPAAVPEFGTVASLGSLLALGGLGLLRGRRRRGEIA